MYKLDKTIAATRTFEEAENDKKFSPATPLGERLRQAWYLTCTAYGIDPRHSPKMDKTISSVRKLPNNG